ncbi:hypothetical protein JVT61DRAFT_13336 [Boletus reticuloceps]|uniref:Uncharacterized protein n=1 Tax=Boletus reticuloceps TaxID=495285 RepID=A0A8I3A387_9AGAM|nr:hypothetical protein JVT61DRAFT_13336 [Boletus reticuloceps]
MTSLFLRPFLPLRALHASLPPHLLAVLVPDPSIPKLVVIPASSIVIQQPQPHHVSALSEDAYLPGCITRSILPPTPQLYFTAARDNTVQAMQYYIPQTTISLSGRPAQAWQATISLPQSLEEHVTMMMTHSMDFMVSTSIYIAERPLLKVGFCKGDHFQRVEQNPTQSCAHSSPVFASQEHLRSFGSDHTMAWAGNPYLVMHATHTTWQILPQQPFCRNHSNLSSSNFSDIPTACSLPVDPTNPPEVSLIITTANDKDANQRQALKEAEYLVIYKMLSHIGWPEIPAKKTTTSIWKQTI